MPKGMLAYHQGVGGSGPCPLFWPPSHHSRQQWTTSLRSSISLLAQQAGRQLSLLVTACVKVRCGTWLLLSLLHQGCHVSVKHHITHMRLL
jgi:hypothetical protein